MRRSFLGAVVVASLLVTSCGSGPTEKPLSEEQVQLIANAMYKNHSAGGISFLLSTPSDSGSGTVALQGEVDFVSLLGHAVVAGGATPNPVTEVFWGKNAVVERRPTLDVILSEIGHPMARFIARPIDMKNRRLDVLISTVMGMGMEQPDNAVLIRQREGSAYVRDDILRDTKVQVLRYGDRLTLWIDPTTGNLLRFEGTNSQRNFPVVIDILSIGKAAIKFPVRDAVVDVTTLGTDFAAWAPRSP